MTIIIIFLNFILLLLLFFVCFTLGSKDPVKFKIKSWSGYASESSCWDSWATKESRNSKELKR